MAKIKPKKSTSNASAKVMHHAAMPRTPVIAVFRPRVNFAGYTPDGGLLGHYRIGKNYYLREGNDMLAALLKEWYEDNKITIVTPGGKKNANA